MIGRCVRNSPEKEQKDKAGEQRRQGNVSEDSCPTTSMPEREAGNLTLKKKKKG